MGLTIHYALQSDTRSTSKVRKVVTELRQRALGLSVAKVNDLIELSGEACNFGHYGVGDSRRWLVIQAGRQIQIPGRNDLRYRVTPEQLIAFEVIPGEGCEPANFGLCRYPAFIEVDTPRVGQSRRVRTKLSGWSWSSFCKTQHASNAEYGGTANFLQCHLSVIKLLDHAKSLDILAEVDDEGDFWEERDVQSLARQVGDCNGPITGLVGRLKSLFGDEFLSASTALSNFESLGAKSHELSKG